MKKNNRKNNNEKKGTDFMKKENILEGMMDKVMANQAVAQQCLMYILKALFEMEGLDTSFLKNPMMSEAAKRVQDVERQCRIWEMYGGEGFTETAMLHALEAFTDFLTMSEEDIEGLNGRSEDVRYALFYHVLNFISYSNHYRRVELLNVLCTVAARYRDTDGDVMSRRAWHLVVNLLIPQLTAA